MAQLFIKISGVLIIYLIFASCQNNSSDNQSLDVLTLRGPSAMSMLFMMEELKELNGYPVSHKILDEPMQIRARMLKEEPEMAILPTNMAANLFNKGVPYQIAAVSVWGTLELFGKDSSINDWKDLKGKRVYLMGKGMTPDILFRFLAKENKLDPDHDLILDYSFPTHSDLANAVLAGLADIAVLSEPLVTMVRRQNKEIRVLFSLEKEWNKVFNSDLAIPQTSLLVRSSFAKEHPDMVISYIREYAKYCSRVVDFPNIAASLAVAYKILPDTLTAIQAIPGCNMKVLPSWMVKETVYKYLRVFYTFNPESIGGQLPDETFFFEK